jgi:hypothetical protein
LAICKQGFVGRWALLYLIKGLFLKMVGFFDFRAGKKPPEWGGLMIFSC